MPPRLAGHPAGHPAHPGTTLCHRPHSAPGPSDPQLPDPPASLPTRPERGAQTYSRGSGAAPTGKMVLTGNGAHPESHQRRTCRCPRSGIPLGRGSCSLSCPASRKHPGPEEKQRRKQESRIREEQWSLLAWKAAWRRQWRGTSLRDLPESGPGRKTAETPEGSVQGPRRGPRRLA